MDRKQVPVSELPQKFRKYFWDVSFDELLFDKSPRFIAERILNYGDHHDIKWLLDHTGNTFIKSVVDSSRNLNPKTKNFWKTILA